MATASDGRDHGPEAEGMEAGRPGRVLVAYATRHGSTAGVAGWIAEELRAQGVDADVAEVSGAPSLDGYDGAIVGGPMILGWHKAARRYLRDNADTLTGMPVALFITAASLTETGERDVDGIPLTKDPWLVKQPRTAGKLTRKERYARPAHYLDGARSAAPGLRPVDVAFFGGSLDLQAMNLLEKLFVMLVIGASPGDSRNRKAIQAWARTVAPFFADH